MLHLGTNGMELVQIIWQSRWELLQFSDKLYSNTKDPTLPKDLDRPPFSKKKNM